jgi:hypothetical protein
LGKRKYADFNTSTIPLLQAAGKDLQGAAVGTRSDFSHLHHVLVLIMILVVIKQLKLEWFRSFTSRLPLVWPGGI